MKLSLMEDTETVIGYIGIFMEIQRINVFVENIIQI